MSSTLKYISCPVSQLNLPEQIGVQMQVDSYKKILSIYPLLPFKTVLITFQIEKDERFTNLSELLIKIVVEIQWNRSDWKTVY